MAVLALVIADNRQQYSTADKLAQLVESMDAQSPQERLEQSRAQAVYHSSFGDLDVAVRAATIVANFERTAKPTAALTRALRWLTVPLKLSNDVCAAIAVGRESFDVAQQLRLPHEMFEAAICLLDLAVDCEDSALAHECLQSATGLSREFPIATVRMASYAYLDARVCAMDADFGAAKQQLARLRSEASPLWLRAQQSVLALEVLVAMRLDSHRPRRETLRRLRRLYLRTRRYGANDFEVGVLAGALISAGEHDDARILVSDYESLRRTRLRRHSLLQEAIAELAGTTAATTA
jgi:hypothetical protein